MARRVSAGIRETVLSKQTGRSLLKPADSPRKGKMLQQVKANELLYNSLSYLPRERHDLPNRPQFARSWGIQC